MGVCKKCGGPKEKVCKPCKSISDRLWRQKNKEHVREYFKKRWQEPERKIANKLYKEINRFGLDAEAFTKDKSCENCGITNDEYKLLTGRRLDINHVDDNGRRAQRKKENVNNSTDNLMVLCRSCHVAWHNKNVREYSESNKHKQIANSTGN
jgi:hypothetical protein